MESPCKRNCCLDNTDICIGCYRSLEEITGWRAATNDEKRGILQNCELRRKKTSGLLQNIIILKNIQTNSNLLRYIVTLSNGYNLSQTFNVFRFLNLCKYH